MTEKVCPRCGAMYEDLKSTTCPECFARLVVVDEETAAELKAARAEVERTPEFQQAKAADDEQFKEQSFGACLGVLAIGLVTVLVAIVIIGIAIHRNHRLSRKAPQTAAALSTVGTQDILTPLPVAAASLNDVMPATVGPYRRVKSDQDMTLSGSLTPLFHGVYSSRGETVNAYAVPTSLPTPMQNQFRQAVELAARIEADGADQYEFVPTQTFATEHWRYAVIGPMSGTADTTFALNSFRQSLGTLFRQEGQ